MLHQYYGDFHIHTCLSPCADLTMSPKRIIDEAKEKQLDIIAICDHNSAENVEVAIALGEKKNITVLPGMEVTTIEEVHLIAIFDQIEPAQKLQEIVYSNLPGELNQPSLFGEQIVVNEKEEILGYNQRLLMTSTFLELEETIKTIHQLGGLAIAAHINREAFSIIGQLGFIPPGIKLDALEISLHTDVINFFTQFPEVRKYPLISSSDAHFLYDVGKNVTGLLLESPTFNEISKAFHKRDGRKLLGLYTKQVAPSTQEVLRKQKIKPKSKQSWNKNKNFKWSRSGQHERWKPLILNDNIEE